VKRILSAGKSTLTATKGQRPNRPDRPSNPSIPWLVDLDALVLEKAEQVDDGAGAELPGLADGDRGVFDILRVRAGMFTTGFSKAAGAPRTDSSSRYRWRWSAMRYLSADSVFAESFSPALNLISFTAASECQASR